MQKSQEIIHFYLISIGIINPPACRGLSVASGNRKPEYIHLSKVKPPAYAFCICNQQVASPQKPHYAQIHDAVCKEA